MNLHLYLQELKINLKRTLIWSGILLIIVSLILVVIRLFFKELAAQEQGIEELRFMDSLFVLSYPPEFSILKMISMMIMLIGSIFAMTFGTSILAREEDYKTIETLYSSPITRIEIVVSKFLALLTSLLFINLLVSLSFFVFLESIKIYMGYEFGTFLLICLNHFLIMLLFSLIGLFISVFVTRGGAGIGIAIGINVFMYILLNLEAIGQAMENKVLVFISNLSLYKHIDVSYIGRTGEANTKVMIIFLTISIALFVGTVLLYRRKDILI